MKADELLKLAKTAYQNAHENYRDALLETGRFLQQFCHEFLKQGDGLRESQRLKAGIIQGAAANKAAEALDTSCHRIRILISASMTAQLLSGDDGLGALGWKSIQLFACFLKHLAPCSRSGRKGDNRQPSSMELWEVKPAFADSAKSLFRQAVTEGWGRQKIRVEIQKLYVGPAARAGHPRRLKLNPEELTAKDVLGKSIQRAAFGDAANLIFELIEKTEDALAVAERVMEMVRQHRVKRKPSFEETLSA